MMTSKKTISTIIQTISLFLTLLLMLSITVSAQAPVSPALSILANELEMSKSCLAGNSLNFTSADFRDALGLKSLRFIKIISLPPATAGRLRLGNLDIVKNQTVSVNSLNELRFVPNGTEKTETSFRFTVNGDDSYAVKCSVYVLPELNFSPTCLNVNDSYLNVSTQKNISYYGVLKASDPENDRLRFKITAEPRKGVLELTDKTGGSYTYTPIKDFTGADSFRYTVYDRYGNRSGEQTVTIRITKAASDIIYTDMLGHWAHNAAIKVSSRSLMCGESDGNTLKFDPTGKVSRAEFLTLAMKAAGITPDKSTATTGFADDADIPSQYRSYVAKARKSNIINGVEVDGRLVFLPNESINRAEAAVILNNILQPGTPAIAPVFADSQSIPDWAYDALCALNEIGVFAGTGNGSISPFSDLDRAMTAQILCSVMKI